ncbi:hypothetical protein D3C75_1039270 [compost metagenome]
MWKVTPLRRVKVQIRASGLSSQRSASSGMALPSTAISLRVLYTAEKPTKVKVSAQVPGSRESVVLPPARPIRSTPPALGVASSAQPRIGKPREKAPATAAAAALYLRKSRRGKPLSCIA